MKSILDLKINVINDTIELVFKNDRVIFDFFGKIKTKIYDNGSNVCFGIDLNQFQPRWKNALTFQSRLMYGNYPNMTFLLTANHNQYNIMKFNAMTNIDNIHQYVNSVKRYYNELIKMIDNYYKVCNVLDYNKTPRTNTTCNNQYIMKIKLEELLV